MIADEKTNDMAANFNNFIFFMIVIFLAGYKFFTEPSNSISLYVQSFCTKHAKSLLFVNKEIFPILDK